MEYNFTTQKFQGPLDLLLHLIKTADIDIFDIDVAKITEQYLNYIESMERLNLNIDSESKLLSVYNISNNNYISLKELWDMLGIDIIYDAQTNSVNMKVK